MNKPSVHVLLFGTNGRSHRKTTQVSSRLSRPKIEATDSVPREQAFSAVLMQQSVVRQLQPTVCSVFMLSPPVIQHQSQQ